jgi:hypothetical protein
MADVVVALPRAGDHVKHAPSGETWLVRRMVGDDRVECCGWPTSQGLLSDCEIVYRCTDEEHERLTRETEASK